MTVGIPAPVRDGSVAALKGKHQKPFGLCRLMLFLIFVTILEDVKEKSLCMLHKGVKDWFYIEWSLLVAVYWFGHCC